MENIARAGGQPLSRRARVNTCRFAARNKDGGEPRRTRKGSPAALRRTRAQFTEVQPDPTWARFQRAKGQVQQCGGEQRTPIEKGPMLGTPEDRDPELAGHASGDDL